MEIAKRILLAQFGEQFASAASPHAVAAQSGLVSEVARDGSFPTPLGPRKMRLDLRVSQSKSKARRFAGDQWSAAT